MAEASLKFQFVRLIRGAGLLGAADALKYQLRRWRSAQGNRAFAREHPDFATPPPHLAFDALNHVDWPAYLESGQRHAAMFGRVLASRFAPGSRLRVLEWGCGPGRLIRQIGRSAGGLELSLTGSDYNPESIAWCRANLPGISFIENALQPPLALPDASFDAIYNFSVFTHLSEPVSLAWAAELRRVLKPGGWLVCTTHGENYRYLLAGEDEQRRYTAGEMVEQGRYMEGRKWFFAIHPERFVRQRLLAGFEAVERVPTTPEERVLQDVWAARRPLA